MEFERTQDGRFKKGMSHPQKPAHEIQQISDAMHDKRYRYLARKSSDSRYGLFECLIHKTTFEQLISVHLNGQAPKNCAECYHQKLSNIQKRVQREWIGNRKKHPRYRSDQAITQASNEKFLGRYKFLGRCEDHRYGKFECQHKKVLIQVIYQHTKGLHPIGCNECLNEVRTFPKRSDEEIRMLGYQHFEGKVYFLERLKLKSKRHYGKVICREHGISFEQSITNYIQGVRGCVLCRRESSKFQKAVFNYLKTQFAKTILKQKKNLKTVKIYISLDLIFILKVKIFLSSVMEFNISQLRITGVGKRVIKSGFLMMK